MSYRISFDKNDLQLSVIHGFLSKAYWSPGVPLAVVERAIQGSICVGCYAEDGRQVGFARAVTDKATFAYLADVFVLGEHCGQGLAQRMVKGLLDHEELHGIRRWMLATVDAHGVYQKLGFVQLLKPENLMEINDPNAYRC